MTTDPYEFRKDGRSADNARTTFGDLRIAEIQARVTRKLTVADEAHQLDDAHPRSSSPPVPFLMTGGWTPAHSAAARFLGECFATGALLGLVTELTRPWWRQRRG
jgi:hypothetical protein